MVSLGRLTRVIAAGLAAASFIASARAQRLAEGPGTMMGPWMAGEAGQSEPMCAKMASNIEGRLAFLKAELKITEAQEPLWTAYANVARDKAKHMAARCTAMMGQNGAAALPLPERLDLREQFMAAQLESLRMTINALKPLYAALDDKQKQAANELFWGAMGMM